MKLLCKTQKFAVVDDLLPREQFERLWLHFQNERYASPHKDGDWMKVWRLTDGVCVASPSYQLTKKPFNNYMDGISSYMLAACGFAKDIAGEHNQQWQEASFRCYIYPRNTKLSWHNDAGNYHAALTYYVHPYWGSTWGGELLVADVLEQVTGGVGPHLDHKLEDEMISTKGIGQWIFPKPNRLVIMAGGVYHSVNRVDQDAGDNARCSIVSFLIKENNKNGQN